MKVRFDVNRQGYGFAYLVIAIRRTLWTMFLIRHNPERSTLIPSLKLVLALLLLTHWFILLYSPLLICHLTRGSQNVVAYIFRDMSGHGELVSQRFSGIIAEQLRLVKVIKESDLLHLLQLFGSKFSKVHPISPLPAWMIIP